MSFAQAEALSLPGRRVEMTAHHALFAGISHRWTERISHCGVATP
jgi:hypothetical protein